MRRFNALLIALAWLGVLLPSQAQTKPIHIGGEDYAESLILTQMMKIILEENGFPTQMMPIGTRFSNRQGMISGEIDLYPEYTGNVVASFLGNFLINGRPPLEVLKDDYSMYRFVSSIDAAVNDIHWVATAPGNAVYAIAMRQADAEANGIVTLADFARYVEQGGEVLMATDEEFPNVPDGLPTIETAYDFLLRPEQIMVIAGSIPEQTVAALAQNVNGINAAMTFATSGINLTEGIVVLQDPLFSQIISQPSALMRGEVVRANPGIAPLLYSAFFNLTDEKLLELNFQVEVEGASPADVAHAYLLSIGLIKE